MVESRIVTVAIAWIDFDKSGRFSLQCVALLYSAIVRQEDDWVHEFCHNASARPFFHLQAMTEDPDKRCGVFFWRGKSQKHTNLDFYFTL